MKLVDFVKQRFFETYSTENEHNFNELWKQYESMAPFRINENVFDKYEIDDKLLLIIRLSTQYHLKQTFQAMKIDMSDPNIQECIADGNIGTAGRVAKMWVGSSINDNTEILCGRWNKPPRIAAFPNNNKIKLPITKRVSLNSCCSHHIAPFSTKLKSDSYAIISYIPEDYVIGISKLQRLVDWVAKRGWLQEDLTKQLHYEMCKIAQTDNVYVKIYNIIHTCELLRGVQNDEGTFNSIHFTGLFEDKKYRDMI